MSIIGPGAAAEIARFAKPKGGDLEAINTGEKAIFVWGRLEYKDAFGTSRFFEFRAKNQRFRMAPYGWGIEPCPDGEKGN